MLRRIRGWLSPLLSRAEAALHRWGQYEDLRSVAGLIVKFALFFMPGATVISIILAVLAVVGGVFSVWWPVMVTVVLSGLSMLMWYLTWRLLHVTPRQVLQRHYSVLLQGNQPAATGTVTVSEPVYVPEDEPAMRVEPRGLEAFPLHPNGYGWLIPSVTITNLTGERMTVDVVVLIDGRRLPAAREQELIETKVRPPRSAESRLPVPVDVPPRGVVHGSLVFVMAAAAYENLPPEVRSTLSLATKVLEVTDLLSGVVERVKLGPENQTVIVQFPKLPRPSRWHRLKRKLTAFWNWL